MKLLQYLSKPEYLFRPSQIIRRLIFGLCQNKSGFDERILPWGLPLRIRPADAIGASVCSMGLYDLTVSEAIWRLLEPGGCALDIGANIGHMSSIMAVRAGRAGTVHLFEPHPQVYQELEHNVRSWSHLTGICPVQTHKLGLSETNGEGLIEMPETFDGNRGTAFVVDAGMVVSRHAVRDAIRLQRLDDFWAVNGGGRRIDVIKIDVEGHELSVLKGAVDLIDRGMVRDIVFEENRPYPTDVTDFLAAHGYNVFLLEKGFWGPLVTLPAVGRPRLIPWEPPAYLATREPERALGVLKNRGWQILHTCRPHVG